MAGEYTSVSYLTYIYWNLHFPCIILNNLGSKTCHTRYCTSLYIFISLCKCWVLIKPKGLNMCSFNLSYNLMSILKYSLHNTCLDFNLSGDHKCELNSLQPSTTGSVGNNNLGKFLWHSFSPISQSVKDVFDSCVSKKAFDGLSPSQCKTVQMTKMGERKGYWS